MMTYLVQGFRSLLLYYKPMDFYHAGFIIFMILYFFFVLCFKSNFGLGEDRAPGQQSW